jgi:hypothetical protein
LVSLRSIGITSLISLALNCQAQYPTVIHYRNDTLLAFTLPQARELTLRNEKLKKLELDYKDCLSLISLKDSLLSNSSKQVQILKNVIINDSLVNNKYKSLVKLHEDEIVSLKDKVKIERNQKRFWMVFASGLSVAIVYLLIK